MGVCKYEGPWVKWVRDGYLCLGPGPLPPAPTPHPPHICFVLFNGLNHMNHDSEPRHLNHDMNHDKPRQTTTKSHLSPGVVSITG